MRRFVAVGFTLLLAFVPLANTTSNVAQAQPTGAVSAVLFTPRVEWRASPGVGVRAELRNAAGQLQAAGQAQADDEGRVAITLQSARGGAGGGGGGQRNPNVRPGQLLHFEELNTDGITVTIPALAVDAEVAANRIVGTTLPGGALEGAVTLASSAGTVSTTLTADGAGAFVWALGAGSTLASGDTGWVTLVDPDGNRYSGLFAGFGADITIGGQAVSGTGTPGNRVTVNAISSTGSLRFRGNSEIVNGTTYQTPAGGGGGGPGGGGGGARQPIQPGDLVGLSVESLALGATSAVTVTVPPITLQVNGGADLVRGSAPAGARVTVTAISPRGATFAQQVVAGSDGAFSASFAGQADLGGGWRTMASVEAAAGIRVRAVEVSPQIRAQVRGAAVGGVAVPGALITVTLLTRDGTEKASDNDRVNNAGVFSVDLSGDVDGVSIEPGDVLEVEFAAGDPVVLTVPELTTHTDPDTDAVYGDAPAGGAVRVVGGTSATAPEVDTTAGADGAYRASFAGVVDITRPMNGEVVIAANGGHEFYAGWSAVQLRLTIGGNVISGNGVEGRTAEVGVEDFSGLDVGGGSATVEGGFGGQGPGQGPGQGAGGGFGGLPQWLIELLDVASQPIQIQTADTIRAQVGDDLIVLEVPPLSGVARVADDALSGRALPGATVDIVVQRPLSGQGDTLRVTVVADDQGIFSHEFAGTYDLQYNDRVSLTMQVDGHLVTSNSVVPGLRLDLDASTLDGSWEPLTTVSTELRTSGGRARASSDAVADGAAVFAVTFRDSQGRLVLPSAGDQVVVLAGNNTVLSMTVPDLTVDPHPDTRRISGRAPTGGRLQINAFDGFVELGGGPGGGGGGGFGLQPQITPESTYDAGLPGNAQLDAGTRLVGTYRLPEGHIAVRNAAVPLVNVQQGGENVCGVADPNTPLTARLTENNATLGTGSAQVAPNTFYSLRLLDSAGRPVPAMPDRIVEVQVAGDNIAVTVPEITLEVDWVQGVVQGTGPAAEQVSVFVPATDCLGPANRDFERAMATRSDPQGAFTIQTGDLTAGQGIEVAFQVEGGHRVYRHIFRSLGQVFVDTDKVTGRANPGSSVTAVLVTAAGVERARGQAMANGEGWFDLRFGGVSSAPTDVVQLSASGENPQIIVEPLTFDFSPTGVVGTAPPDRDVRIDLELADGRTLVVDRHTSQLGAFRFDASEIPPRSDWGLDDVIRVRVTLPTPGGHEIVAEIVLGRPDPTPGPPGGDHTIYLPATSSGR